MKLLNTVLEIKDTIANNEMVAVYFTTTTCNMCKDLFPKIEKMLEAYPEIIGIRSESDVDPLIIGEYQIFMAPTIVLFVQGKETIRRARNISIPETSGAIDRYYDMLFK